MKNKNWFYLSLAIIIIGLFSPTFMIFWDLSVQNALDGYYGGDPSFEGYFLDDDDAARAQRMVDGEIIILIPFVILGFFLIVVNFLWFKFFPKLIKFSLIFSIPYFIICFPTILLLLT